MRLGEMYVAMFKLKGEIQRLVNRLEENPLDGRANADLTYKRELEGALLNDIQDAELLEIE